MIGTALLIVLVLVIVGLCILGLKANMQQRMNRETGAPDGLDRERAEAIRQISRDIDKGKFGGLGGM